MTNQFLAGIGVLALALINISLLFWLAAVLIGTTGGVHGSRSGIQEMENIEYFVECRGREKYSMPPFLLGPDVVIVSGVDMKYCTEGKGNLP